MFLIEQGIGVHHAQVESLGYGWSWVSGTAEDLSARYGWLEYSTTGRMHYKAADGKAQYTAKGRMHYDAGDET